MSKGQQKNLWVIVVLMFAVLWSFDLFPFSLGQTTIYIKECSTGFSTSSDLSAITSCSGKMDYSYITYRPNVVQNSVTFWTDDGIVGTWKDCSIKDKSNWSCITDGTTRTMKEGNLVDAENNYKRRIWKGEYFLRKYNLMGAN